MSDIFKEVDEDVRKDLWLALWHAYGKYLIALAVGIVLAVAGRALWTEYSEDRAEKRSTMYEQAVEKADVAPQGEAAGIFRTAREGLTGGYASLAGLQEAAALVDAGDARGAVAVYDVLGSGSDTDPALRNLAIMLGAGLRMDAGELDQAEADLSGVVASGGPNAGLANEMLGHIAYARGDLTSAIAIFAELAGNPDTGPGLLARAEEMLGLMGESVVDGGLPAITEDADSGVAAPVEETPKASEDE